MRTSAMIAAVAASHVVHAFPKMDEMTAPLRAEALKRLVDAKRSIDASAPQGAGALPSITPPFDAAEQLISVSGEYAFVAPTATDARGECPGLNAMANHGYLPHNGVATISEFTVACQEVFGMGADLAAFLAIYGAILDGDGTSWSIAGASHVGIGGSHGNYETDSSPLKADLYQYGDMYELIIDQYKDLRDLQPDAATSNYNLEVLREFRATRFQQSIAQNPYFVYGPFNGMAVSQAAFTFIYRFMANHSAEYPEGVLNRYNLNSFMAITGTEENPVWTKGYERIPENWYRRSTLDAYTIPYFVSDILYFAETEPQILGVGCNAGEVNTYQTIDASVLSNGAYTAEQLLESPLCFAIEFALAELPGLTGLSASLLSTLTDELTDVTGALDCTSIGSVNTSALALCPGYSLYGGPTAAVAPGSIQSQ